MSWRDEANCRGMALEIFYVGSRIDQERMLPEAKAACDGCAVRAACLEEAIQQGDVDGVRGGLLGRERRVLIRHRKSLIPKKNGPIMALGRAITGNFRTACRHAQSVERRTTATRRKSEADMSTDQSVPNVVSEASKTLSVASKSGL